MALALPHRVFGCLQCLKKPDIIQCYVKILIVFLELTQYIGCNFPIFLPNALMNTFKNYQMAINKLGMEIATSSLTPRR